MTRPLDAFDLLTFDCFGTLIDWERGILDVLRPWAARNGVKADDDALLAAFARAEPAEQAENPSVSYPDILRGVMRRLARDLAAFADAADAEALARSVADWPAFPDTPNALERLKRRARLVIVSNVDAASFSAALPKLGVEFDAVVSAEETGAYKPDVRMFRRTLETVASLDVKPRDHLHVAQSLFHDIVPTQALGIATCWIDRRQGLPGGAAPEPARPVRPDFIFTSLADLAEATDAAAAARCAAREAPQPDDPAKDVAPPRF